MKQVTMQDAFEVAIATEKAAQTLFQGLEAKFANHEDLAVLWQHFAEDESHHATWLSDLRSRLTAEQLAQQVDTETIVLLQAMSKISVEKALTGVQDLDDAYNLVNELENGETNAIFQFLLNNFEMDLKLRDFLRNQLNMHIARLETDLPSVYKSRMTRQAVQALS